MSENLPHCQWQPLWYCGNTFHHAYSPALRYGVAVLTKVLYVVPAHAYHVYIALFYALGIVGVYFLVRVGNGSRSMRMDSCACRSRSGADVSVPHASQRRQH